MRVGGVIFLVLFAVAAWVLGYTVASREGFSSLASAGLGVVAALIWIGAMFARARG